MKLDRILFFFLFPYTCIYTQTIDVTTNADSGANSLRQAITDINSGSDSMNTINLQIPGNDPITIGSDLPVIKKGTSIKSTGNQTINGNGQYRLFATIMADLTINNCTLINGAAIGGNGYRESGGGMGAGGGIYIDRGNILNLLSVYITGCQAKGGTSGNGTKGGGASFSDGTKNQGGDYPGTITTGGASDGSPFLTGYGGGSEVGGG